MTSSRSTTITVLVENAASIPGLRGEHGLSIHVSTPGGAYLWDTGQSGLVTENADILGVRLDSIDAVALSHGHYDHTGGLAHVLERSGGCVVFGHPAATGRKLGGRQSSGGAVREIGMPFGIEKLKALGADLDLSAEPREIGPGVSLTGEIPRTSGFEDAGGSFFLDDALTKPDIVPDDQSLLLDTDAGHVLLLGCCHAGLVNTLNAVENTRGVREFALIAGGLHLLHADEERIGRTLDALGRFEVREWRLGHCTGVEAFCRFRSAFPGKVQPLYVGWTADC